MKHGKARLAGDISLQRVIAAALAALCASASAQQTEGEKLAWSGVRPLEWSDFRGPVDPTAADNAAATTAASLNWSYKYRLERSDRGCTYRITEIETEAMFHPQTSWVRPGHANDRVLEHEQGHFDLTQIHKMMLDSEARDLVDEERDCGSRRASLSDVEEKVAEIVTPVRDRVWRNLQRVQEQYDAETQHGILGDAQREWTARIQEALRRGRWE
jgi:hypothetical protein